MVKQCWVGTARIITKQWAIIIHDGMSSCLRIAHCTLVRAQNQFPISAPSSFMFYGCSRVSYHSYSIWVVYQQNLLAPALFTSPYSIIRTSRKNKSFLETFVWWCMDCILGCYPMYFSCFNWKHNSTLVRYVFYDVTKSCYPNVSIMPVMNNN